MRTLFDLVLIATAGLSVTGCSTPDPLIDRINVPDAKYNRDAAACRDDISGTWIPFTGTSMGDCMRGKGYHVLMNNSGL